jgi:hypothetical protein
MKDKIIEILMSETFNTSDEAGNSYIVTSSEDFEDIAERIVKLFAIPSVSSHFYQIDFGNHLRCKIKVTNNRIEVEAAMNGWGNSVPLDEVVVVEVQ